MQRPEPCVLQYQPGDGDPREQGQTGLRGLVRDTNVSLVSAGVGDHVIVHADYAIRILDPEEAKKTSDVWNEYFDHLDG